MSLVLDGSAGVTFNNGTVQASAGSVIQTVSVTKTDNFSTTSTSFINITGLTVAITPKFATSKILVLYSVYATITSAASQTYELNLVRNSTAINTHSSVGSTYRSYSSSIYNLIPVSSAYLDSPATTSATTYLFQIKSNAGDPALVNSSSGGAAATSTITVMEIAG
jgi:hypothetical protein